MGIRESKQKGIEKLPEHKQKQFMVDYGAFYGVEDRDAAKLDYNKLYQASREAPKDAGLGAVPKDMRTNSQFVKNSKVFFAGEASETASQYDRAVAGFFADSGHGKVDPTKVLGGKFNDVQERIVPANMDSEVYKRNYASFNGDEHETKSQGSIFKNNLSKFHGVDPEPAKFKVTSKAFQGK